MTPAGYWFLASIGALILVGAAVALIISLSGGGSSETYDECIVREMRGQAGSMYLQVAIVCRQRHPETAPREHLR
jgi:hypothetical protein